MMTASRCRLVRQQQRGHKMRCLAIARRALLTASILIVPCTSWSKDDRSEWKTYHNGRFGYSVSYPPSQLRPLREADNGDGREFRPLRGGAKVTVWASYSADQSLDELASEAEKSCLGNHASYKVVRNNKLPPFMALSCLRSGRTVFYTKAARCRDVITQIDITYPENEKSLWVPIVTGMSLTLSAGCGVE